MRLPLAARVAVRYLFAGKSHSAVMAISAVSVCGIAVATAAIVCVLSVFNGFCNILTEKLDTLAPDVLVQPAKGKVFSSADSIVAEVRKVPGVEVATPVISDNALVIYQGREMPVMLKGVVPDEYSRVTAVKKVLLPGGKFRTVDSTTSVRRVYDEDVGDYIDMPAAPDYMADISIGVASRMGATTDGPRLLVFAPRRSGRVDLSNPITSFLTDSVAISGIFQTMQGDYDNDMIITDLALARDIFQYPEEASAVEVSARPGIDGSRLAADIGRHLGDGAVVKDRMQQQALNFRMISIEKWVSFLLLAFILVVASFNIISTLSMLVLDKQASLSTLYALGARKSTIGAIFAWESYLVSFIGCVAGIVLGVTLCLLQQHFGFIKLAGDPSLLVVKAYPVAVEWSDLLTVLIPVVIIGSITAIISYRFARNRTQPRS